MSKSQRVTITKSQSINYQYYTLSQPLNKNENILFSILVSMFAPPPFSSSFPTSSFSSPSPSSLSFALITFFSILCFNVLISVHDKASTSLNFITLDAHIRVGNIPRLFTISTLPRVVMIMLKSLSFSHFLCDPYCDYTCGIPGQDVMDLRDSHVTFFEKPVVLVVCCTDDEGDVEDHCQESELRRKLLGNDRLVKNMASFWE